MADVTLSKAVRSNLLNLQSTAELLGKTQERLATGLKVNSALDNPTNFFTASSLNSRASDLGRLLDSVSNAVQTIAAADKGVTALTKLVESAQATARQALQTAASVDTTSVSTQATVSGTVAIAADVQATADGTVAIAADVAGTVTGSVAFTDDTTATATGSAATGSNAASTLVANGDTFAVTIGSTTLTYEFDTDGSNTPGVGNTEIDASGDIDSVLAAIQADIRTNGGAAAADATFAVSGGNITLTLGTNTSASVTTASTFAGSGFGIADDSYGPTSSALTALSSSLTVTTTSGTDTLNFSSINSVADLTTALAGLSTSGATYSLSSGAIKIDAPDNATSFTVGGTAATSVGITAQDYDPTNTAIGALSGTLTFTTTDGTDTLTFGAGGIQNRAQLTTALAGLSTSGVTASIDGSNHLTFDGANSDTVTVGGTIDVNAAFGIAEQDYDATNATLGALSGTLTVGSNTLTFGAGNIQTRAALVTALGSLSGGITGSIDGSNHLKFDGSGGASFTVGGTLDNATVFGITEQAYNATSTTTSGANPKRDELRVQYNDLLDQIDQLAKDSGFNGVNLLNGDDLSVLFNEDGSSKLDITGVTYTSTGLGLTALASGAFDTNASINSTLDDLKAGIDTLRTQASKFGSNLSVVQARQDFTKNMINVLQTGASNLTLADTNEEAANLLALQTRQQLSSTALSLASQSDQNVLRLF